MKCFNCVDGIVRIPKLPQGNIEKACPVCRGKHRIPFYKSLGQRIAWDVLIGYVVVLLICYGGWVMFYTLIKLAIIWGGGK